MAVVLIPLQEQLTTAQAALQIVAAVEVEAEEKILQQQTQRNQVMAAQVDQA
jgi:hypothetical protein